MKGTPRGCSRLCVETRGHRCHPCPQSTPAPPLCCDGGCAPPAAPGVPLSPRPHPRALAEPRAPIDVPPDGPRILLTVVVIFRILIVAIVGETVYEDEQTMFMCNTLQPGCNQACYDKAFPISHIRYWVFQIILVCTPSLCFITYSVHQAAKQRERRYSFLYPLLERDAKKARTLNGVLAPGADGGTKDEPECLEAKELPSTPPRRAKAKRQEGISRFYVIQVVFRNALEIGFLAGQYFLYGFNVPAIFECDRYPCVKEVECYVSRPTEKTVFLVFMFAVSGICVLLNLAELNHLGWRKVKAAVRGVQARRKSLVEVRKKDGAALTPAPTLGRTQSSESAYV
uniref:Gap junction protein n=1 Tax=Gallus gallus TaxID=9031 RepID=A0A8V0Y1C0_CHICK